VRAALALGLALIGPGLALAQDEAPRLGGRAVLPSGRLAPGPASGRRLQAATHGVAPPFAGQPIQGVSGLVHLGEVEGGGGAQRWLALVDNGYGTPESSADFRLRLYPLTVDFRRGSVEVGAPIELADPDRHVPWPIVEQWTDGRPLTGADFDPESIQRAPDGTLWIGEELGPFVLHVGPTGRLLEPPLALPDPDGPAGRTLASPHSPLVEEGCGLRALQALDAHRRARGGARPPVCAAWELLLDDRDPKTGVPTRLAPPAGLPAASSELFDVAALHAAGFRVVPWTVNDPARMGALIRLGVDGLISDDPELLWKAAAAVDLNQDGVPDLIGQDGLLDPRRFDAQGHRGARDLRPENTLPAFEAALDWCMTTLETDCGLTADGVVVLCHDARLSSARGRRLDGAPYGPDQELVLRETTLDRLQSELVADRLAPERPKQTNDRALSPVAVAFARERRLVDPYVVPTLQQLLQFTAFYAAWYGRNGQGGGHPDAARRALNARRVRFDVETKVDARRGPNRAPTPDATTLTRAVLAVVERMGLAERTTLQSFDVASLLVAHEVAPAVETAWLVGDFPAVPGDPSEDGASFQGAPSPWLAGLGWPYRVTRGGSEPRVRRTGGLEGMALSPDGRTLHPLLEKPLVGAPAGELLLFELDLETRRFGPTRRYQLDPRAAAIGDFQLLRGGRGRGLVLERDDSEGDLTGFKRLFLVELGAPGEPVKKTELLDLLAIPDPDGVAPPVAGDVGLGARFALPLQTLESVVQLGPDLLVVANDSNYPFQAGRHVEGDRPDDTELVLVRLPKFDE
jgi:glycerophosphoryl diester phosphodiesterase